MTRSPIELFWTAKNKGNSFVAEIFCNADTHRFFVTFFVTEEEEELGILVVGFEATTVFLWSRMKIFKIFAAAARSLAGRLLVGGPFY